MSQILSKQVSSWENGVFSTNNLVMWTNCVMQYKNVTTSNEESGGKQKSKNICFLRNCLYYIQSFEYHSHMTFEQMITSW